MTAGEKPKSIVSMLFFVGSVSAMLLLGCLFVVSSPRGMGSAHGLKQWQSSRVDVLASMGTGMPVFTGLQVDEKPGSKSGAGRRGSDATQNNLRFVDNDQAKADWQAAGKRGIFLGTVAAPKVCDADDDHHHHHQ
jgi:hypothetical protein